MLNFKDRVNIFFNKGSLMLVHIYGEDKRKRTYVKKRTSKEFIYIGEDTYTIDTNLIFIEGGMPSLSYLEGDSLPVNYMDSERFMSSAIVKAALEENISKKIMNYAKDDDKELLRKVMLIMGMSLLIMAVGFFFMYDNMQTILERLPEIVPDPVGVVTNEGL